MICSPWQTRLLACLAILLSQPVHAEGVVLKLQIPQEAARYAALIDYPGAVGVALENAGLQLSLVDTATVSQGGRGISVRNLSIQFRKRTAESASFEASILVGTDTLGSRLRFPVEVDLRAVAKGNVEVRLLVPGSQLVPTGMLDKLQTKLQKWSGPEEQKRVLDYLASLKIEAPGHAGVEAMVRQILVDGYNRRATAAMVSGNAGEAIPVSEQWMLITSLALWVLGLPMAYLLHRRRRPPRRGGTSP